MRNRYQLVHRPISDAEAIATRARAGRLGQFSMIDPVMDEQWARLNVDSDAPNPYLDYYYSAQDIRVYVAELGDDPEFGEIPIHDFGFRVEQEKAPIYGYASYCVDEKTEAFTHRGWVNGHNITEDDIILSMKPSGELAWSSIKGIYRDNFNGKMHYVTSKNIDALVTPGHKIPLVDGSLVPVEEIRKQDRIRTMGTSVEDSGSIYTDDFVELVGWCVTEGHYRKGVNAIQLCQSMNNFEFVERIDRCLKGVGAKFSSWITPTNKKEWYISNKINSIIDKIKEVAPNRVLTMEFLIGLSTHQRQLLLDVMLDGDGWRPGLNGRQYIQKCRDHIESFVSLCTLLGINTVVNRHSTDCYVVTLKVRSIQQGYGLDFHGGYVDGRYNTQVHEFNPKGHIPTVDYNGLVWCPETDYGTFVCRRNNKVYVTGNTYDAVMRGTRLISGQFTLITKHPDYMKDLLTRAATKRVENHTNPVDDYPAPGAWRADDENIDRYWGKHLDVSALAQGATEWSAHPPFSFVVVYGVQDTSLEVDDITDVYENYERDNALLFDRNQRLVESFNPNDPSRIILDGCELMSVQRAYSSAPGQHIVAETYEFFARDIFVPRPHHQPRNLVRGRNNDLAIE